MAWALFLLFVASVAVTGVNAGCNTFERSYTSDRGEARTIECSYARAGEVHWMYIERDADSWIDAYWASGPICESEGRLPSTYVAEVHIDGSPASEWNLISTSSDTSVCIITDCRNIWFDCEFTIKYQTYKQGRCGYVRSEDYGDETPEDANGRLCKNSFNWESCPAGYEEDGCGDLGGIIITGNTQNLSGRQACCRRIRSPPPPPPEWNDPVYNPVNDPANDPVYEDESPPPPPPPSQPEPSPDVLPAAAPPPVVRSTVEGGGGAAGTALPAPLLMALSSLLAAMALMKLTDAWAC